MKIFYFYFHSIVLLFPFLFKIIINTKFSINKSLFKNKYNKRKLETILSVNNLVFVENLNENVEYIGSTINEKGDVYIITNSDDSTSKKRLLYIIKSDYSSDIKIMSINSATENKSPLLTILRINGKENLVTYSTVNERFELIDYINGNVSPLIYNGMRGNSFILKNTFISLKYYNYTNYIISIYSDKVIKKFRINKLYYRTNNINSNPNSSGNQIECLAENIDINAYEYSPVSCFEIGNYVECLYTNSEYLYTVSIIDISNLNIVYNQVIDSNMVTYDELFSKCIFIKNNIGSFIYFLENNNVPKLQFKYLEINGNNVELINYFDSININSKGVFALGNHYIFNDFIKVNDNNIFYVSTEANGINLYVILIKLLNSDQNLLINYYNVKLNYLYNIGIYKDITAFSLNGLLGIGMTVYNYNLESKTNSILFVFGNLTIYNNINITLEQDIIFNEENIYEIKISEIKEKINIVNNIFGYIIEGIKITKLINEENGFFIYSNNLKDKIKINQIISSNDTISFKILGDVGIKLGNYSIEFQIIIKEPDYDNFILNAYPVEYYSINSENNDNNYSLFFEPDIFVGKKFYINFSFNKCYKTCQNCSYFGDNINHHCDICLSDFPFSYVTTNGYNCVIKCPDNYTVSENNICLYNEIEENEEKNNEYLKNNEEEEYIKEEEKSSIENKKENEEINNEEENKKENEEKNNEEENRKENDEKENKKENEIVDNNKKEEEINKNKYIEKEINKNNFENICKKYFYIDDTQKIHCIDGDKCIDDYPLLDKRIKNLCTNCIYNYKNKCYMDCPQNTCIKQDKNLDTCIDIETNTKVINQICFENFQDLVGNIKEMSENNIIIENIPNLTIYVYDIEKNISYFEEKKLTYIYFKDIQDVLIQKFNLEENSNIYALIVDSPSKYSNSTINDYGFVLLLENGTELDLSNLDEDLKVRISIPIINLDLANFNYASLLSEQGYDIYDKNSNFYHDICTPGYLDDNDIAIKDRKKEIFPNNVTTGKSNCEYHLTDINSKRFIYNCYINDININNTNNNEENHFEDNPQKENIMNYFLDVINYKVLNCSILFLNLDNFRHNKAVMICSTSIFISILFLILFLCKRISKIRIIMFKEIQASKISKISKKKNKRESLVTNKNNNAISNPLSNPLKKKSASRIKIENCKNKYENQKNCFSDSMGSFSKTDLRQDKSLKKDKNKKRDTNNKQKNNSLFQLIYSEKKSDKINNQEKKNYKYDDLPFKIALEIEDRKIFYILLIKLTEKIKIIDICINREIKEILLSEYFLYLLIDLTMNAMLYSDNIVSHKSHNNGKLDTIIVLSLSGFANILSSIIGYYLGLLIGFEERIFQIKEIKKEKDFLRVFKIILREIIIRVIIFFILEILIILFCTYYLFIFFTIYHKSQMSLLKNYLISILENMLINIIVAIFIVFFRKIGIYYKNKYIYNTSKYLDKNF